MRQATIRERILLALAGGPASASGLQAIVGADSLHDEIWGANLRGLIRDGEIVKVLGEYRLKKGAPTPIAVAPPTVTPMTPMTPIPPKGSKPVSDKKTMDRSASGLREALFDAIEGLRNGTLEVKQANAIAVAAGVILKSIDVQVAYERLRFDKKITGGLPELILVGSDQG